MQRRLFSFRLRRSLTLVLLAAFVYQLGACPCGCAKHDYWRKLLHVGQTLAPLVITSRDAAPFASADDDDCTHKPRDRSRVEVETRELGHSDSCRDLVALDGDLGWGTSAAHPAGDSELAYGMGPPPDPITACASRTLLQVFRL